jgi:ADP-heptose:LPS heptosyltransferase
MLRHTLFLFKTYMSQRDINKALQELNANKVLNAQSILLKIIKKQPANIKALTLLGIIKFQFFKKPEESLYFSNLAIKFKSKDINSYLIAGVSAIQLKKYSLAHDFLYLGYKLNQKHRDILFNLAINYTHMENADQAINFYKKCLTLNENDYHAQINLANLLTQQDQTDDAEKIYLEMLRLGQPIIYKNYLSMLFSKHDYKKALLIAEQLCELEKNDLNLIEYLRAAIFMKSIELSELLLEKIEHKENPNYIYLKIMHQMNKDLYQKSLEIFEDHFNIGDHNIDEKYIILYCNILGGLNQKDFVKKKFKNLLLNYKYPVVKKHYSLWLLENNSFNDGFKYYRSRLSDTQQELIEPENCTYNQLKDKNILLIGDQGIGDQIFYLRFIKKVKKIANNVTIAIDKKIIPIIKKFFPDYQVIPIESLDDKDQKIKNNIEIIQYLGDMPGMLNLDNCQIKDYVFNIENQTLEQEEKKTKRIGISWNSKAKTLENEKSISLEAIEQLIQRSNHVFVNLQYDNFEDIEILKKYENFEPHDEINKKDDLLSLCNLIDSCDYVITISNSTAHLSGLKNKKTFLLIPNSIKALWYWHQVDNNFSTWYPSMRIIYLKNKLPEKIVQEIFNLIKL